MKTAGIFLIMACALLAISVVAHITAWVSIPFVSDTLALILCLGMFLLGIASVILYSTHFEKEKFRHEFLKRIRPCFRHSLIPLMVYTAVTFIFFFLMKAADVEAKNDDEGRVWATHVFSVFWMFFYYLWTLVLWTVHFGLKERSEELSVSKESANDDDHE